MSGGSKKVTVGYKYYLGMHLVLCHGPIDFIKKVRVDNRLAWSGFTSGGRISIRKPGLFGGEDREGGVSGDVDIDMGRPDQTPNTYLKARLGDDIPAFRGVVSAVLRQAYLGMNPYLKPWAFRAQRVYAQADGSEQWYKEKAPIGRFNDAAIYIAIDVSGSMSWGEEDEIDATPSRLDSAKEALGDVLDELAPVAINFNLDISVVAWATGSTSITRRNANSSGLNSIKSWINNLTADGATDFEQAMSSVVSFFDGAGAKPKTAVFITDGEASPADSVQPAKETLFSVPDVRSYGINIFTTNTEDTAEMDNTPGDGVPVVSATNPAPLRDAILNALLSHVDMNPSHIIRECLTDNIWGMGYLPADIGDDSFTACADTLYDERMGISLLWDRQIPIEEFVNEIVRHINAALYVDKINGKFTLKLIRNDYDVNEIPTLNESNIVEIKDYSRVDPGDAINSVTVVYWDATTGENASVTADDPALIQAYGTVVNTTIQYPGFTNANIAARAAARDLQTLSSPLLSCTIETTRDAFDLNIGDVFKLEWPKYHSGYIVMRVHQISYGDGKKNQIKIKASEDVFALPSVSILGEEESGWEELGGPPLPSPLRLVQETPYLELVQQFGQTQVDNALAQTPEAGYLQLVATRPDNGLNAQAWVDDGAGYEDGGPLDFPPTAVIQAAVDRVETQWSIAQGENLDQVQIGTHGQIGDELVRVDAIDEEAGTITVGRAVLDSIPLPHGAGTTIVFWDLYAASNLIEYVAGEQLDVKILTNSNQGTLELPSAPVDTVLMDQRPYRPFRPGNLKAAGSLEPALDWFPNYPVEITWATRNRVQETGGDLLSWVAGDVTPEPNTDYRIKVEAVDLNGDVVGTVFEEFVASSPYSLTADSIPSQWAGYPFMRVTVHSRRDSTLLSRNGGSVQFRGPFRAPTQLIARYRNLRAPVSVSGTLVGD